MRDWTPPVSGTRRGRTRAPARRARPRPRRRLGRSRRARRSARRWRTSALIPTMEQLHLRARRRDETAIPKGASGGETGRVDYHGRAGAGRYLPAVLLSAGRVVPATENQWGCRRAAAATRQRRGVLRRSVDFRAPPRAPLDPNADPKDASNAKDYDHHRPSAPPLFPAEQVTRKWPRARFWRAHRLLPGRRDRKLVLIGAASPARPAGPAVAVAQARAFHPPPSPTRARGRQPGLRALHRPRWRRASSCREPPPRAAPRPGLDTGEPQIRPRSRRPPARPCRPPGRHARPARTPGCLVRGDAQVVLGVLRDGQHGNVLEEQRGALLERARVELDDVGPRRGVSGLRARRVRQHRLEVLEGRPERVDDDRRRGGRAGRASPRSGSTPRSCAEATPRRMLEVQRVQQAAPRPEFALSAIRRPTCSPASRSRRGSLALGAVTAPPRGAPRDAVPRRSASPGA